MILYVLDIIINNFILILLFSTMYSIKCTYYQYSLICLKFIDYIYHVI